MNTQEQSIWGVDFASLDGLELQGTFTTSDRRPSKGTAVLVHGGGVTRDEGGFYTRMAQGLADSGVASLRFDFRGHGQSQGRQEDLTLAGVVNDIRAATEHARQQADTEGPVALIAASFSGGLSTYYASARPHHVGSLVLINPLIDYKKRFIDDKPYWSNEYLTAGEAHTLSEQGFIPHSPTFKLGRPLLNEVLHAPHPDHTLEQVKTPTLIVHGTKDTFIPVESSRHAGRCIPGARLLEVEGAQHGIAVHEDPAYADPQTQQWQAMVIEEITQWVTRAHPE